MMAPSTAVQFDSLDIGKNLRKAMVDSEFCFIGLNQTLLSAEINGSIVGLLAAFIDDGTSMRSSVLPKT